MLTVSKACAVRGIGTRPSPATRRAPVSIRAMQSDHDHQGVPLNPSSGVGERLGKWLATPFDLAAFGPRAGAGLLVSLPERLQTLQSDVQRVIELVQDPRPIDEKQNVLLKEVESTVIELLEKGVNVERDVLSNLKTVLPPEVATVLSEVIPEPPNSEPQTGPVVAAEAVETPEPVTFYGQQDVVAVQVASEITEIHNAVSGLKAALDAMRSNADVANTNILKLNLKEARDQLTRRLAEVSPVTATDPSIAAATREASILLDEVNAMFF